MSSANAPWGGDYDGPRSFGCFACGAPNPFPGLCQPCAAKHRDGLRSPQAPPALAVAVDPPAPAPAPAAEQAPVLAGEAPRRKRGRPRKVVAEVPSGGAGAPALTAEEMITQAREMVERGELSRDSALVLLLASTELTYALADRLGRF